VRRLGLMLRSGCAMRCRMCDLWLEPETSFPADRISELLASRCLAPDVGIHLTGGEPYLYPGIVGVYGCIREGFPRSTMSIHSSGAPASAALDFLRSGPDLRRTFLFFSYDGVGTHDFQRGRQGAEADLLALIARVRPVTPRGAIILNCTITPWNAGSVRATFAKARELGVGIQFQLVNDLPQYTNSVRRPKDGPAFSWPPGVLAKLEDDLRGVFNGLSLLRERHEMGHLLRLIETMHLPDGPACRLPCPVASQSAFVRSDGSVLTCRNRPPVGNALREGLDAAMGSVAAARLRREGCGSCERRFSEF
jgi:MoaA/NifB/PqqE/SkfB family radical SAM enzyme